MRLLRAGDGAGGGGGDETGGATRSDERIETASRVPYSFNSLGASNGGSASESDAKGLGSASTVFLSDRAGGDCTADCCGLGAGLSTPPSLAASPTSSACRADAHRAACAAGSAPAGVCSCQWARGRPDGGRRAAGPRSDGVSAGGGVAAGDFGGAGDACAGLGSRGAGGRSDSRVSNSDGDRVEIVITDSCRDLGEIEPDGARGSSCQCADVQCQGAAETGGGVAAPAAAAAAALPTTMTAEGAAADGRRRLALHRWAADGVDSEGAADAAPPAEAPVLGSVVDPDGTADCEAGGVDDCACQGGAGEGAAAAAAAAADAETAALLEVYLRRVQPCRESLDLRAQSAGAALLRSDLGSALFTRFALKGLAANMRAAVAESERDCDCPHAAHNRRGAAKCVARWSLRWGISADGSDSDSAIHDQRSLSLR